MWSKALRGSALLFLQVLLDQLTFGPFCNAVFMSYIALVVEGEAHFFVASPCTLNRRIAYRSIVRESSWCLPTHVCGSPIWPLQVICLPFSRLSARQQSEDTVVCLPGRSWDFTKAKLYTDFSGVQKNGWRLWPLASWITYQYIPLRLRVLFVNIVAFFWCVDSDLLSCYHACHGVIW